MLNQTRTLPEFSFCMKYRTYMYVRVTLLDPSQLGRAVSMHTQARYFERHFQAILRDVIGVPGYLGSGTWHIPSNKLLE